MHWWIPLGGLVLGMLVLGLAVRPVLRRLPVLRRALIRLNRRVAQAQTLRAGAETLQQRMATLAERTEQMQAQAQTRARAGRQVSSRESAR